MPCPESSALVLAALHVQLMLTMHLGLARVLSWKGASRRPVGSADAAVGLGGALGGSRWAELLQTQARSGGDSTCPCLLPWDLCISTGSGQGASMGLADLSERLKQETVGAGTSQFW